MPSLTRVLLAAFLLALAVRALAQSGDAREAASDRALAPQAGQAEERVGLHGQFTWIRQFKPAFSVPYTGPNSLLPDREWSFSRTITADLGLRLWPGAQLHLNPEAAAGLPLSRLTGAGGISNAELQRGASPAYHHYWARAYLQQRIDVGGPMERIEADFNELGGLAAARRWTLVAGTFSVLDFMDPNPYAKDPREQFTNWSFLTHGAWDFPADARGYTSGALAEYRVPGAALRFGRAAQPKVSNGLPLDYDLNRQWGDFAEVESDLPWRARGGPMRARLLVFRNHVHGGDFREALTFATATGGVPDLATVRRLQSKGGWGVTLEAPLGPDEGLFLRASASDGRTETYAFTEIDRQIAVGGQFSGARWGRSQDRWGLGMAFNGLKGPHRDYLAAGGRGAFLGDGRLAYAGERVVEGWYRWSLPDLDVTAARLRSALSVGLQLLRNPGYNSDRSGPVQVWMTRFHTEF